MPECVTMVPSLDRLSMTWLDAMTCSLLVAMAWITKSAARCLPDMLANQQEVKKLSIGQLVADLFFGLLVNVSWCGCQVDMQHM